MFSFCENGPADNRGLDLEEPAETLAFFPLPLHPPPSPPILLPVPKKQIPSPLPASASVNTYQAPLSLFPCYLCFSSWLTSTCSRIQSSVLCIHICSPMPRCILFKSTATPCGMVWIVSPMQPA